MCGWANFTEMNENENKRIKLESVKSKILLFTKENNNLIQKIKDHEKTLELNYELLKTSFIQFGGKEEIIKDYISKGSLLFDKYDKLIQKRKDIKKEIYSLKQKMEIKKFSIFNEINDISKENQKLKEEIKLKDSEIKKLKENLIKLRQKAFFKEAEKEIKVCGPDKNNIIKNQEIINGKKVLQRAMNIHSKKEIILKQLKEKYKILFEKLKKESEEKSIKIDNIQELKIEEEDEESEEQKSSSSEEDLEEKKKKCKNPDKIKEELREKYNNLQKKYIGHLNQIKKYKQKYKDYQKKITDLKANIK